MLVYKTVYAYCSGDIQLTVSQDKNTRDKTYKLAEN